MSKDTKRQQYFYKGYVLYESDLKKEVLIQVLTDMVHLHDVFQLNIKTNICTKENYTYTFDSIRSFDQITFTEEIDVYFKKELEMPAELKLIYFNEHLRGFTYQLDKMYFNQFSVLKIIQNIEKGYFKSKYKPLGTSFFKWIEIEKKSFEHYFSVPKMDHKHKTLLLNQETTLQIKSYMALHHLNLFQFMTGLLSCYFKSHEHKDFIFQTDFFDDDQKSIVGNLESPFSYELQCNLNLPIYNILQSSYSQLDHKADVFVQWIQSDKHIKGVHHHHGISSNIYPLGFVFKTIDRLFAIEIIYDKNRYNKDSIFLMMNKLKLTFEEFTGEEDQYFKDIQILTQREEQNALSYAEPYYKSDEKSLYERFLSTRLKNGEWVAFENGKHKYNYIELSTMVTKISKVLSKSIKKGQSVYYDTDDILEKVLFILAIDQCHGVVTDHFKTAHYHLKKSVLGYKIISINEGQLDQVQYIENETVVTSIGYRNYCSWFSNYFDLDSNDRILFQNNLYQIAIPALIGGTTIVFGQPKDLDELGITLAVLKDEEVRPYKTLKHAIVTSHHVPQMLYQLHYGMVYPSAIPFIMMGIIDYNKIKHLTPVFGVGMMLLHNKQLTAAKSKGTCYIFGPGIMSNDKDTTIHTKGLTIEHVQKTNFHGAWSLDGEFRLYI